MPCFWHVPIKSNKGTLCTKAAFKQAKQAIKSRIDEGGDEFAHYQCNILASYYNDYNKKPIIHVKPLLHISCFSVKTAGKMALITPDSDSPRKTDPMFVCYHPKMIIWISSLFPSSSVSYYNRSEEGSFPYYNGYNKEKKTYGFISPTVAIQAILTGFLGRYRPYGCMRINWSRPQIRNVRESDKKKS